MREKINGLVQMDDLYARYYNVDPSRHNQIANVEIVAEQIYF